MNFDNYNELLKSKVGNIDSSKNEVSIKDCLSVVKSRSKLGRLWCQLKLFFSGKGWVNKHKTRDLLYKLDYDSVKKIYDLCGEILFSEVDTEKTKLLNGARFSKNEMIELRDLVRDKIDGPVGEAKASARAKKRATHSPKKTPVFLDPTTSDKEIKITKTSVVLPYREHVQIAIDNLTEDSFKKNGVLTYLFSEPFREILQSDEPTDSTVIQTAREQYSTISDSIEEFSLEGFNTAARKHELEPLFLQAFKEILSKMDPKDKTFKKIFPHLNNVISTDDGDFTDVEL